MMATKYSVALPQLGTAQLGSREAQLVQVHIRSIGSTDFVQTLSGSSESALYATARNMGPTPGHRMYVFRPSLLLHHVATLLEGSGGAVTVDGRLTRPASMRSVKIHH